MAQRHMIPQFAPKTKIFLKNFLKDGGLVSVEKQTRRQFTECPASSGTGLALLTTSASDKISRFIAGWKS